MLWLSTLVLLLDAAGSALGDGILVLPGGSKDTVVPLTLLSPLNDPPEGTAIRARHAASVPLRIMSLGASVTFGPTSSIDNSYKESLRDMLVASGSTVEFVGELDYTNPQVQGQDGLSISQVADLANRETPLVLPNLVLMGLGANDCKNGEIISDAGANVTALINDIFAQSPGSTVILSTVPVNTRDPAQDACRVDINTQYTALAAHLTAQGAKMMLVDMRGADPDVSTTADLADVWFQGIQEAAAQGFITVAMDNGISSDGGASGDEAVDNSRDKVPTTWELADQQPLELL
ncbi:unnamed protein product [Discula destructiva]